MKVLKVLELEFKVAMTYKFNLQAIINYIPMSLDEKINYLQGLVK